MGGQCHAPAISCFIWLCSPARAMASLFARFLDHTQWHATFGRTPLDEWSVCWRDLYLTTHNYAPIGIRTRSAIGTGPRLLYPRERPGTHCKGGWIGPRASLEGCRKSRLKGIRSPDRPAHSELLYRLRYAPLYNNTNYSVLFMTLIQSSTVPTEWYMAHIRHYTHL
jgi:hypothetical protein